MEWLKLFAKIGAVLNTGLLIWMITWKPYELVIGALIWGIFLILYAVTTIYPLLVYGFRKERS